MNNEIVNALETLAAKLGTTSEYLWSILLKQAPISAITDLIQYGLLILACVIWSKKMKNTIPKILNKGLNENHWAWVVAISIMLGIFIIVAFFSIPNTIYALVNPEYWALDRLLSKLK